MTSREDILKRITREVNLKFELTSLPFEYRVISAKYSRMLKPHGGTSEALEELRLKGLIRIEYNTTGGRRIFPGPNVTPKS